MYHKYVAFVHKRLSTILFGGQSLALADRLTMILRDLEDHPSAWIDIAIETSGEPSHEHSLQNICLCMHIMHVIFVLQIYTVKNLTRICVNFRYTIVYGDIKIYRKNVKTKTSCVFLKSCVPCPQYISLRKSRTKQTIAPFFHCHTITH